jgi:hypothetical protein
MLFLVNLFSSYVLSFDAGCSNIAWGEALVELGYLCRETTSAGLLTAVAKVGYYLTSAWYTHSELRDLSSGPKESKFHSVVQDLEGITDSDIIACFLHSPPPPPHIGYSTHTSMARSLQTCL